MNTLILWQIISGVDSFLNIISVFLVVYALMTWVMRPDNSLYVFVARIADAVLMPFRPIGRWFINKGMRVDLSVMIALLVIQALRNLLTQLAYGGLW